MRYRGSLLLTTFTKVRPRTIVLALFLSITQGRILPGEGIIPPFFLKCNNSTTVSPIEAAIDDLKPQEYPNIITTARKFQVNRSTLLRRYKGVASSQSNYVGNISLLSLQQSKSLVSYNKLTCMLRLERQIHRNLQLSHNQ